jgi:hypothetical protein
MGGTVLTRQIFWRMNKTNVVHAGTLATGVGRDGPVGL